eukprot:c17315_g1_i1.p1 GENE.c17315_g1_i1~~c17315_g1_i1.p1  ORF type:complete len:713 (-),score=124.26 c17315_g1_i1:159-2264(-)
MDVASLSFHEGNFAIARQALESMKTPNDPDMRVDHNITLCDFFLEGAHCQAGESLLSALEGLRRDLKSEPDDEDNAGPHVNVINTSLVTYNIAVLHIHFKRHSAATRELEELFQYIDQIESQDGFLAVCVCLLLSDLHIMQRSPDLALKALSRVERIHAAICIKTGAETESASATPDGHADQKEEPPDSQPLYKLLLSPLLQAQDAYSLGSLLLGDLRDALSLRRSRLQVLERVMGVAKASPSPPSTRQGSANPYVRHSLHVLGCQLDFVRGNTNTSLASLAQTHLQSNDATSQPPFVVRNICGHELSLIGGSAIDSLLSQGCAHFNNMGAVLMRKHKYAAALELFFLALKESDSSLGVTDAGFPARISLRTFAHSARHQVLYNAGVCLLMLGREVDGAACLIESSQQLSHHPYLWLRLAECCVSQITRTPNTLVVKSHENCLVLQGAPAATQPTDSNPGDNLDLGHAYGMKCCRNCLTLLNKNPLLFSNSAVPNGTADTSTTLGESHDLIHVWYLAHLNLAYLALCANDPTVALASAETVLNTQHTAGQSSSALALWHLLARLYAAEASVMLNDTPRASSLLLSVLSLESLPTWSSHDGLLVWRTKDAAWTSAEVRAAVLASAAVVTAQSQTQPLGQDTWEKSGLGRGEKLAKQAVSTCPESMAAKVALAYVSLLQGNRSQAAEVFGWVPSPRAAPLENA